jgi:hypothetical protein
MGCGCCGCPGVVCSECSGTPDKALYVTTSGITPVASGTCYTGVIIGGLSFPAALTYTGVQDYASCILQNLSAPCNYANGAASVSDLFTPLPQLFSSTAGCGSLFGPANTVAVLKLASGVYTLYLYSSAGGRPQMVHFIGTASIASPPCRLAGTLTFSNTVVPGTIYNVPTGGGSSVPGYGYASGGSAAVAFQKKCCP